MILVIFENIFERFFQLNNFHYKCHFCSYQAKFLSHINIILDCNQIQSIHIFSVIYHCALSQCHRVGGRVLLKIDDRSRNSCMSTFLKKELIERGSEKVLPNAGRKGLLGWNTSNQIKPKTDEITVNHHVLNLVLMSAQL